MRNLITGGAGFIGSHLAEALLARGEEVVVLDNLSTGSMDNVAHLKGRPGFELVIDSMMNEPLVNALVDDCDLVYHLGAAVGVKLIVEAPVHTIETNIHGTELVLRAANRHKRKVLLASTSEVYGKSPALPFREDDDIVLGPTNRARWSYACSKAIDEFLALAYYHEKDLPVVIVRFFNTVGPRQIGRLGMVIPSFVKQALLGLPITVYGDGSQRRAFTNVADSVGAAVALAHEPRAVGEVVNVGNDSEISMLELAHLVREMAASSSEIVLVPYEQAYAPGFEDIGRRLPDLSKAQRLVGYRPRRGIKQTLAEIIDHMRR